MSATTPRPETSIRGVLPVFQTPYLDDGTIDFATLDAEIAWLFDHGADGVVMAMVSELLRLNCDERRAMAERVCRCRSGRGVAVISVGAESTFQAIAFAQHAQRVGADAVMAIPPVATALGDAETCGYYQAIIESIEIPVVVQDASGYVGRPMSIELQARLLEQFGCDRVLFKPEANPIGPRLSALRDATGGKAPIFEGTGGIALVDSFRRGIVGTMPGADLIWAIRRLWDAMEADDPSTAYRISGPLASMISMQTSLDGFLAIEKHLLVKQGVFRNAIVRGPVGYSLDTETCLEVDRLFDQLQHAVAASKASISVSP